MGLFAPVEKGLKGLFGDGFGMKAARAVAILNGNAAGAAAAEEAMANSASKKKAAADNQSNALHAYGYFKSLGMDDNAAFTLATDPEKAAAFVSDRLKLQQYGSSGGSSYDPISNQSRMAPSRHEFQGSVYDVGGGAEGQKAPVTSQHEGTQWITPQPGAQAFPVNSFTGLEYPSQASPTRPPVPVRSAIEMEALPEGTRFIAPDGKIKIKTGGQTPRASDGFPQRPW